MDDMSMFMLPRPLNLPALFKRLCSVEWYAVSVCRTDANGVDIKLTSSKGARLFLYVISEHFEYRRKRLYDLCVCYGVYLLRVSSIRILVKFAIQMN